MPFTTSASPSPKPFTIAIIGGGIAGLSLTIGLLHHNIPVTLYEAAPAFAEIGAGVSFGPNALRAMALIDPAIREGYDCLATSNAWPSKRGVWFDFRWGVDERAKGDTKRGKKAGDHIGAVHADPTGQSSVHRAHFLSALVSLVPAGVAHFGKRLDTVADTPTGVLLTFTDGTTAQHTTAIACDGVKSRMRPLLLGPAAPAATPTFTGKYAYRGLIPMGEAVSALGDELARNAQMHLGYGGHVLTFPIEHGATMNVVAFRTQSAGTWDSPEWVVPVQRAAMLRDFEGWGNSVRDIVALMQRTDVWALFDHPAAETYYRAGKVCLLGDAAHASTPHQGAGAGMALEDAFILSGLLGDVREAGEIESAFRAYDSVRRPRTQRLVATSRDAAAVYEFQDGDVRDDAGKIGEHLQERYRWIWEEDLEEQLRVARASMGVNVHLA